MGCTRFTGREKPASAEQTLRGVGAQYDAVYRDAFSKRKGREAGAPKPQFIPLQVGS